MRRTVQRVLAAMLLGVLVVGWPGAARADVKPALVVTSVEIDAGSLEFLATAQSLKPGTDISPDAIRVSVDGQQLTARARRSDVTEGLPSRGIAVVIDASATVTESGLAAAKAAAIRMAGSVPADASLSVVVARPTPEVVQQPTKDRDAFTQAVNGLTPAADGGPADLVDTILAARAAFDRTGAVAGGDWHMLVFSDGRSSDSGADEADTLATVAEGDVVIDAINTGYGINEEPVAFNALARIATETGGRAVRATSQQQAEQAATAELFPTPLAVAVFVPPSLAGQPAKVTISVEGRADLSATVDVVFAGAAAAAGGPSLDWVPDWAPWAAGALIFVGLFVAFAALFLPRSAKDERIKQIANFGPGRVAAKPAPEASAGSMIARTALAATASVVRSGHLEERIGARLERAGMRLRPAEWVLLRVCVTIAVGALLFAVAGLIGGLMGLVIGWLVTMLYQTLRIDRRSAAFSEQLPDALQLMIGSLRSGFSLPQSLESLVREAPEPVGAEFGRALAEHKLGADVSDALERVGQRTQSEDLGWAVMAVRIQREVGGNLAEVLQTTVDTMRDRARLRRHVRSLSAEGRISAWVLIGLPIGLSLFMFLYRRDYMVPLVTDPVGITLLIGGGMLFVVGIVWLTRVVKVDA